MSATRGTELLCHGTRRCAQAAQYFSSACLGASIEDAGLQAGTSRHLQVPNVGYNTYSYRANIDINLTKTTKIYFGSDGFP